MRVAADITDFCKKQITQVMAASGVIFSAAALGLFFLYVKHDFLGSQWYLIARHYDFANPGQMPWYLRCSFYVQDLVNTFLYLPLLACIIVAVCGVKAARIIVSAAVFLLAILAFYQLQALSDSGAYLSWDLLLDGVRFFVGNFSVAQEYIRADKVAKLLLFLAFAGLLCFSNSLLALIGNRFLTRLHARIASTAMVTLGLCGIAFLALGWSLGNSISLHRGALQHIVATSFIPPDLPAIPSNSIQALLRDSDRDTGVVRNAAACGIDARAKQKNIILFVLETAPDDIVDWDAALKKYPPLAALENDWVRSRMHFTSYPYTSDALYSILSGTYPLGRRVLLRGLPDNQQVPALFSLLKPHGYKSAVFVPSLYESELDEKMFRVFGADKIFIAAHEPMGRVDASQQAQVAFGQADLGAGELAAITEVLSLDLTAYAQLQEFVRTQVEQQGKYLAMFLPQLGHAPWKAVINSNDLRARGRKLVDIQLQWLSEMVEYLQAANQLDNTIILVTGDHGIRTRVEDPSLPLGQLSDYSFKVPLLLYAGADSKSYQPASITSHVDLMASLLAMNGLREWMHLGQGVPLWCRAPDDRIYFFAQAYGGVDGYAQYEYFTMVHSLTGRAYAQAGAMDFSPSGKITMDDIESVQAANRVRYQEALQLALAKKLLEATKEK